MSALFLSSIFTTSLCPLQLAMNRGVAPSCVWELCSDEWVQMANYHYEIEHTLQEVHAQSIP